MEGIYEETVKVREVKALYILNIGTHTPIYYHKGSFFLHLQSFLLNLQNFFKFPKKPLWLFKEIHEHHTPKITFGCRLPEVKIYDFRKSKYIAGSRFLELKIYHRKSTFESQNISPEVDFQKSKCITESQLPEVKMVF